jgi:hypothetical protein
VEILGYDTKAVKYTSHYFDSQGHVTIDGDCPGFG